MRPRSFDVQICASCAQQSAQLVVRQYWKFYNVILDTHLTRDHPHLLQDPTEMEDATIGAAGRVDWSRIAVVFYCEFSSQRGPRMFRHIRNLDRRLHLASYPALAVPHMYVLAGGYKAFQVRRRWYGPDIHRVTKVL